MTDQIDRTTLPTRPPVRKSVAQVDGGGAGKLEAARAEAPTGLGGGPQ
jgi:hypothetical protein